MDLGAFLGGADGGEVVRTETLPSGPAARAEGDDGRFRRGGDRYSRDRHGAGGAGGYGGGGGSRRGEMEAPMRSDGDWRRSGPMSSSGLRGAGPPSSGPMERPSHMRLNLSRRGEGGSNAPAAPVSSGMGRSADVRFNGGGDRSSSSSGGMSSLNRNFARATNLTPQAQRYVEQQREQEEREAREAKEKAEKAAKRKQEEEEARKAKEAEVAAEKAKKEAIAEAEEARKAKYEDKWAPIVAKHLEGEAFTTAVQTFVKQDVLPLYNDASPEELSALTKNLPVWMFGSVLSSYKEQTSQTPTWAEQELLGEGLEFIFNDFIESMNQNIAAKSDDKSLKAETKMVQLAGLYKLQVYFVEIDFPKGLLERVFMALYENDVIAEGAFIEYKYDVNDDVPGKMNAIFNVTNFLNWIETAPEAGDSEEESDEEDSDEESEEEEDLMEPNFVPL